MNGLTDVMESVLREGHRVTLRLMRTDDGSERKVGGCEDARFAYLQLGDDATWLSLPTDDIDLWLTKASTT